MGGHQTVWPPHWIIAFPSREKGGKMRPMLLILVDNRPTSRSTLSRKCSDAAFHCLEFGNLHLDAALCRE